MVLNHPNGASVLVLQPDHRLFGELPATRLWRRIGPRPIVGSPDQSHGNHLYHKRMPEKVEKSDVFCHYIHIIFTYSHSLGDFGCHFSIMSFHFNFISSVATANERVLMGHASISRELSHQYPMRSTRNLTPPALGTAWNSPQFLLHRGCFSGSFARPSFWGPLAEIPCRSRRSLPTSGALVRANDTSRLPNGEHRVKQCHKPPHVWWFRPTIDGDFGDGWLLF